LILIEKETSTSAHERSEIVLCFSVFEHFCVLLQVDTSLDWLEDVPAPSPSRALVAGSVEEALRGLREEEGSRNKDAVMHSLCLFTVRVHRKSWRFMLRG
jgi:hypothetical protein